MWNVVWFLLLVCNILCDIVGVVNVYVCWDYYCGCEVEGNMKVGYEILCEVCFSSSVYWY